MNKYQFRSKKDLTEKVIELWNEITPEICLRYLNSMPKGAKPVYDAKKYWLRNKILIVTFIFCYFSLFFFFLISE